jgi:hypothetical protein
MSPMHHAFQRFPYCFIFNESNPHPIEGQGRFRFSGRTIYRDGTRGALPSKIRSP